MSMPDLQSVLAEVPRQYVAIGCIGVMLLILYKVCCSMTKNARLENGSLD